MDSLGSQAPALRVSRWFNSDPITLEQLRGRVVVLHAFQMLCPGCVSHALPQAAAIAEAFAPTEVAVIGIHTVFEHHAVMGADALQAFIHEYRIRYPVAIDEADPAGDIPLTMQAYRLRGTPSLLLIDRSGAVRLHHFGRLDDLRVGALIGRLLAETGAGAAAAPTHPNTPAAECDDQACGIR